MIGTSTEEVVEYARAHFDDTLERLCGYLRVPAISCDPQHHQDVRALAARIAEDLRGDGFSPVEVLELDGALPLVVAELALAGPQAPTVLIYGHLDLQPVAGEVWTTPPHEPTRKGDRLYARGAADDMGGWVSHLAAIAAYQAVVGAPPCNLKLVIEGEEEIGSPNLERYMDAYPQAFAADVMVLTDCENPSTEIPGLTVSLRGLLELRVDCEALQADVHSGLWGNAAPDVSTALLRLLNRLVDEDGRLALGRMQVPEAFAQSADDVPIDAEVVARGARLVDGVACLPARGRSVPEWLWRQPALTILSTTLPQPDAQKNALRASASAVLSVRVAPGQTADGIYDQIRHVLLADPPPASVRVSLQRLPGGAESWLYEPVGPVFEAVDRAYEKAFGHAPLRVGVGGSIPFVALFGRRYADLPLVLNGVMDPQTGAHGPDESLHLGVFERAIEANIRLLAELAEVTF